MMDLIDAVTLEANENENSKEQYIINVFNTLQVYLGSLYVNDFNFLGRTYKVMAQADSPYRARAGDNHHHLGCRSCCCSTEDVDCECVVRSGSRCASVGR